jgi:hypothetical protein
MCSNTSDKEVNDVRRLWSKEIDGLDDFDFCYSWSMITIFCFATLILVGLLWWIL